MPKVLKKSQEKMRHSLFEEAEEGQLTVDVYQAPAEFVIQTAIAGVKPDDLDVNITEDMVIIRGKRERAEEFSQEGFLYQECFWGPFSRTIILPGRVDPNTSAATLKNGVLTIRLPKVERTKNKQIEIS